MNLVSAINARKRSKRIIGDELLSFEKFEMQLSADCQFWFISYKYY